MFCMSLKSNFIVFFLRHFIPQINPHCDIQHCFTHRGREGRVVCRVRTKTSCPCRVTFLLFTLHKGCCYLNCLPTCSHFPYGTAWQIRRRSLWEIVVVFEDINRSSLAVWSSVGPESFDAGKCCFSLLNYYSYLKLTETDKHAALYNMC